VAIVYILVSFFLLPAVIFGLSLISGWALLAVGAPFVIIIVFVVVVNVLQVRQANTHLFITGI
jgi:sodium-dependent phosphate cotransporter